MSWQNEVERPWIGMTNESMTDVEQARADLAEDVIALKAKLHRAGRLRHRLVPAVGTVRIRRIAIAAAMAIGAAVLVRALGRSRARQ